MNDIETSRVTVPGGDGSDSSNVCTTCDHAQSTNFKLQVADDLSISKINLDGVMNNNHWVRVADRPPVMSDKRRNDRSMPRLERVSSG